MALTIDATVGGSSSNSYVDISYADTYLLNHPYASGWATAQKHVMLVYATNLLDNMVDWYGDKDDVDQALEWPRITGVSSYDDIIPVILKKATCELVLHLINNTELVDTETINKIQIGPIKLGLNADLILQAFPPVVTAMISTLGQVKAVSSGAIHTPTLIRA